jgi:hypothetical protein
METGESNNGNERCIISNDSSWFSQFRNASNPWMARYAYALIFLLANLLAWAARDYGRSALTEMESKFRTFTFHCHISFSLLAVPRLLWQIIPFNQQIVCSTSIQYIVAFIEACYFI